MREGGVTLSLRGSRRAKVLLDHQIWTQELEKQETKEKEEFFEIAQSRNQHW